MKPKSYQGRHSPQGGAARAATDLARALVVVRAAQARGVRDSHWLEVHLRYPAVEQAAA